MTWWRAIAITAAIPIVCAGVVFTISTCSRPPYNHVLTSVERIDEDEDALRVYHDKARGVTCYETYGIFKSSLACVPDVWLKDR